MPTFNMTPQPPLSVNPDTLVLIGPHKIAKTLTVSKLDGVLILVTDPKGTDHITAARFDIRREALKAWKAGEWKVWNGSNVTITEEDAISPAGLLDYFEWHVIPALRKAKPAKYVCVDTLDELGDWIIAGLDRQKAKLLLNGGRDGGGVPMDSILEQRFGAGERMVGNRLTSIWAKLSYCADRVIHICHIKKSFDPADPTGKNKDAGSDVDLPGQVRKIPLKYGAAIGTLKQRVLSAVHKQLWVSFRAGADTAAGNRVLRLEGRDILLSESKLKGKLDANGILQPIIDPVTREPIVESFTTYWDSIYLPEPGVNGTPVNTTTPTQTNKTT